MPASESAAAAAAAAAAEAAAEAETTAEAELREFVRRGTHVANRVCQIEAKRNIRLASLGAHSVKSDHVGGEKFHLQHLTRQVVDTAQQHER